MPIQPHQRFKTAREYVDAHDFAWMLDEASREALCSILVKRNGIWSVRRTEPKDAAARCALEAYRVAKHLVDWGYLPSYRCEARIWFFRENPEQIDRFDKLSSVFAACRKFQLENNGRVR